MNIQGIGGSSNLNHISRLNNESQISDTSSLHQVNISEQAQMMDQLSQTPEIRQELVSQIQQQIADGTYLDEAKLEIAMENMLQDLI